MARIVPALLMPVASGTVEKLQSLRWFGSKSKTVETFELLDYGEVQSGGDEFLLLFLRLSYAQGGTDDYFVPLSISGQRRSPAAPLSFSVEHEGSSLWFEDALYSSSFLKFASSLLFSNSALKMQRGTIKGESTSLMASSPRAQEVSVISTEQSNTSVVIDGSSIYKSYRKIEPGENPDYEIPSRLAFSSGFRNVPGPLGKLEYRDDRRYTIGSLSQFVENEGDCWTYFTRSLGAFLANAGTGKTDLDDEGRGPSCLGLVRKLGKLTSSLHNALASLKADGEFTPVAVTSQDKSKWADDYCSLVADTLALVRKKFAGMEPGIARLAGELSNSEKELLGAAGIVRRLDSGRMHKIRIHGDYHLGQVLKAGDEFYIIDFEGEPMRSLGYRRSRHCALRDVSGMLRSLDYAISFAERKIGSGGPDSGPGVRWRSMASSAFLESYWSAYSPVVQYLPESFEGMIGLVRFFTLEKAVYELRYEMNNRPSWVDIPMRAIRLLVAEPGEQRLNNDFN